MSLTAPLIPSLWYAVSPVQLIAGSNLPNTQVTPDNTEWNISFDQSVSVAALRHCVHHTHTQELRATGIIGFAVKTVQV